MQLEELERQWRRLDEKIERSLAMQTELLRRVVVQPARRRVTRLAVWPAIDVVFCLGLLLAGQSFLRGHWGDWRVVAPAATIVAAAFALLATSIHQLALIGQIDWSGPVAGIQAALQRVRAAKIRQFKWVILLAPLAGFCGLAVGTHWLLESLSDGRADLLNKLDGRWLVGNYVFGVLFVPLGYLAARVLAKRCRTHRWWHGVLDDIAGNSLKSATLDIDRWASLRVTESDS